METTQLIELALKRRDEYSFGKLHAKMYPYVFSVAFSFTRNHQLSEDVAQATFLILHKQGRNINSEPALLSWLWKTTRFTALRAMRDEIRRQKKDELLNPSTTDDSESSLNHIQVVQALKCLGNQDRNIIVMRYLNECSVEEVAKANRMTVSAAQMRISRSLEKMRKHSGMLSVALVISALSTKSAEATMVIPAVPTLKTASALAVKLSQPVGIAKLTLPFKLAIASNPLVTGVATSVFLVGGGFTYWYLSQPHYKSDIAMIRQFEQVFGGRYTGEISGTKSDGGFFKGKMIAVIRREQNPDRIVLRSQYGDREVSTLTLQFVEGTDTFFMGERTLKYKFNGNAFSFNDLKEEMFFGKNYGKKEAVLIVADISVQMEIKDDKLFVTRNVSAQENTVEKMELTRK